MSKRKPLPKGRLTRFNDDICKIIIDAVTEGNTLECAAGLAGIAKSTLSLWMTQGGLGHKTYVGFYEQMKKAEAESQSKLVKTITTASERTWTAAAWMLERKYPETWGLMSRELKEAMKDIAELKRRLNERDSASS